MDLTTLPTTSPYSGSIPYPEEDDRVTLFVQRGVHDQLCIERAIWWCHREMDSKRVRVEWRDADQQSIDDNSRETAQEREGEQPIPTAPDDPVQ